MGVFANTVVPLPRELPEQLLIVNATDRDRVVLELQADDRPRTLRVTSVEGASGTPVKLALKKGLNAVDLPASGYAVCVSERER